MCYTNKIPIILQINYRNETYVKCQIMSSKFQDGAVPITAAALPRTATVGSCVESSFINVIQNCIKVSNPVLLTLYAMFLFPVHYC